MTTPPGWVVFDAVVEAMPWGRNVYTVIRLDAGLEDAARTSRTRRVEGTIDDLTVNVGVNRADVLPDAFMYAGKGLLRRLGAKRGDLVRCQLRPADPSEVLVSDDIRRALADAGRRQSFDCRTPAQRRRLLQPIEDAASPETRGERITALMRLLPSD